MTFEHLCLFVSLTDWTFAFTNRRLSQRPTVEELEQRNILKRECIKLYFNGTSKLRKQFHKCGWRNKVNMRSHFWNGMFDWHLLTGSSLRWFRTQNWQAGLLSLFCFKREASRLHGFLRRNETGFYAPVDAISKKSLSFFAWDFAALTLKAEFPAVPPIQWD